MISRALVLTVAVLLVGCDASATLVRSDYQTTCQVAADCVPVWVGSACAVCACSNTAINRSSLPQYQADARARAFWCPSPGNVQCAACFEETAACDAGQCALQPH
jgi:hypothetical protein